MESAEARKIFVDLNPAGACRPTVAHASAVRLTDRGAYRSGWTLWPASLQRAVTGPTTSG